MNVVESGFCLISDPFVVDVDVVEDAASPFAKSAPPRARARAIHPDVPQYAYPAPPSAPTPTAPTVVLAKSPTPWNTGTRTRFFGTCSVSAVSGAIAPSGGGANPIVSFGSKTG